MSTRAMNWAKAISKECRLTSTQRLVLMILAHYHHDRTNACFPAMDTIAEYAGLTKRTIQTTVRELDHMGLITVAVRSEHGRQRSNQFDLFGKLKAVPSDTRAQASRGEADFTPQTRVRGEIGGTPQMDRGVKPTSPDRYNPTLRAGQTLPNVVAFPRAVGGN